MTEINLNFMALVFVVFMITMYLLNTLVFRPMLNFMDKRDKKINQDLAEIDLSSTQISDIDHEISTILQNARDDAKNMITAAVNEAKSVAKAKEQRHFDTLEEKNRDFAKKLEADKIRLKNEIFAQKEAIKLAIQNKF